DRSISVLDLASGKEIARLPGNQPPGHLAVHPTSDLLAVAIEASPLVLNPKTIVQIRDRRTGQVLKELPHETGIQGLAWNGVDNTLAAAGMDHRIYVWDSAGTLIRVLAGHDWEVFRVAYSHSGEWLASSGFDLTTRIWNSHSGKQLLVHPSYRWVGF